MSEIRKVHKLYNIDLQSIDEENRQITFCFSDDQPDRQGEIVDQTTWDVKNYMQNPVILWGHDPDDNENVLGQGVNLDLNRDGKSFITAQFDDAATNPKADMIFRQLIKRTLRTVSAGFISHSFEWQDDTPVLKDNELLEVSVVAIPANPRAIARSLKDGSISRKDATWMLDSMKKEAAELEKELAKPEVHNKEENVEEIKTQLSALTDAFAKVADTLNKVSDAQATQAETLATLNGTVTDLKTAADEATQAAQKAAEDEATAAAEAEAKAAEEAAQKAADEANGPKDDNATTAEDGKTTDSDSQVDDKTKDADDKTDEPDAAKDGEIDQSGAVTDKFDENAELTPELQAQIDAELEQTLTSTAA